MLILIINAGSSSIKYQLLNMDSSSVIAKGLVERIGIKESSITHEYLKGAKVEKKRIERNFPSHVEGMEMIVELLTDEKIGVIKDPSEVAAVGHRIVQGGNEKGPALVTEKVKDFIREISPLAPLHNPANLLGIEIAEQFFKGTPQVVVYDTSFHQTMPPKAFRYAIPNKFYSDHKIRAYGAHGTSHKYVRAQAVAHLKNTNAKIITLHLGNGSSITAINEKGESVDTSMGFTPLNGLVMGTRSGDIDPSVLLYMVKECGVNFNELDDLLNKKSGLLGLTGKSDVRDIGQMYINGDPDAVLCLELYAHRVKKYIGAYLAILNGADALVFTAGIGENAYQLRSLICKDLDFLGIKLDEEKNKELSSPGGIAEIHHSESKIKILIIPTNEELEIANETLKIISGK
ncbi:MAG: acetate kinase [Flavobacteriaceae bacterium]|jgi:acetate kinase|nr:acetate kinase [Flavobacteriaceae bacterium]